MTFLKVQSFFFEKEIANKAFFFWGEAVKL